MSVVGLEVLDLRTFKPDGTPWDFTRPKDRALALKLLHEKQPKWVIAAPPCTSFSILNANLNYPRMTTQDVEKKIAEGLTHMEFVCKLYRHQLRHGGYFLHEHPRGALSWKIKPVQDLLKRRDVHVAHCDQCEFEAKNEIGTEWKDGKGANARLLKPIRFMSNSVPMLRRLHRTCKGQHAHQPLLGGRAAAASFYPLPLLKAILEGMNDTEHTCESVSSLTKDEYEVSLTVSMTAADDADACSNVPFSLAPGEMPVEGGGTLSRRVSG